MTEQHSESLKHPSLFNLGFRPFFMGASLFAPLSIAVWLGVFFGFIPLSTNAFTTFQWHAHEMIYGYSFAVIAGFLLTAVKNWTGIQTPHGYPLAAIFLCWLLARFLWLFGDKFIAIAALFDMLFAISLLLAIADPIIKTRQWRQLAILSKVILLGTGNAFFYLDVFGLTDQTIHLTIYAGIYLIIGLILTMGRRVIPMFIQNGVQESVTLFNSEYLDRASLLFFLIFFISGVFANAALIAQISATIMFIITTVRIVGWYTPGIWKSPLLWCFFVALLSIDLGFILYALEGVMSISPYLSIHAFAVGGIGMMTMGMMARVSIGHTGRKINSPPRFLFPALLFIAISIIIRVVLPLYAPSHHTLWIALSGLTWLSGFSVFCFVFISLWLSPRIDKKYG